MKSTAATLMLVVVLLGSAGSVFAGEASEPRQMRERMTTAMSQGMEFHPSNHSRELL